MDLMEFNQIVPRIKVLETKLLDKSKIDRMIDSSNANEALKVLLETEYGSELSTIEKPQDYEILLSEELERIYKLLYSMTSEHKIIDIMAIKYDYHNLKVLIKSKALNKDMSSLLMEVGVEEIDKLKYAIANEYYMDLNSTMRTAVEESLEKFTASKDPQVIDIILDKYMFIEMSELSKELGISFIENYVKSLIDLINIKTLLRVKKQRRGREFLAELLIDGGAVDKETVTALLSDAVENIPNKLAYTDYANVLREGMEAYSKTGYLNVFEKLSDNYIMDLVKEAKFLTYGVEPLFAYLIAKETEIKIVRIIMICKLNEITPEVTRERLRDSYA